MVFLCCTGLTAGTVSANSILPATNSQLKVKAPSSPLHYGQISQAQDDPAYYYFSDSYQFNWSDAALKPNKIESLCRID